MKGKRDTKYHIRSNLGIFRKFLFSFIIIAILPIVLFGIISLFTVKSTGNQIFNYVKNSIDNQTKITMELQASLVAKSVSRFLKQRENDLILLKEIPRSPSKYLEYSKKHKSSIWIRTFTKDENSSAVIDIPMYKEISFINSSGKEVVKIYNNRIVRKSQLKNVSKPKNTTYKSETYFNETKKLKPGKIYVSHLTGFYVSKKEQLGNYKTIEDAVNGVYYNGVIRFATPIYSQNHFAGIVMIALDQRLLMEFTQHILPDKIKRTVFPSYRSGNYAFMFDDEGWTITHPKLWDIRGVDKNGKLVPAYSSTTSDSLIKKGIIPFNLDEAAFIHPNYPFVSGEIRQKNAGLVTTINIGGTAKVMAYAPIIYSTGAYKKYGVFGGITIGAELNQFHRPALSVFNRLLATVKLLRTNIYIIILVTTFIVALISWFISLHFSVPILEITKGAKKLAEGRLDKPLEINREDEIGELASAFNYMSSELRQSKAELIKSFDELKKSKSEIEIYTKDLEYQIKIFKTILNISNLIGRSFDIDKILHVILQKSVEIVGFDRAILYLVDDNREVLKCKDIFGFINEEIERAKKSEYSLEHINCIETNVVKTGKSIFVKNFNNYPNATEWDIKIRKISKSNSFVFVPLTIQENVIGILGADKVRSKNEISSIDINSLQILANQASRIIENTRLYTALIKEKHFVEDILKYMSNGIITTDAKGCITSINKAAEEIFEIKKEDVVGNDAKIIFKNEKKLLSEIEMALTQKRYYKNFSVELTVNGNVKYTNVSISPIGKDVDAEIGFITVIQDITQNKIIDMHLQRIDRLASLGRFAAGIAHEIRNPLTGISLFLDDFHDRLLSKPEISSVIEQAINEIGRLEELVNELLDYASPQNSMELKITNLNKLIDSTIHFTSKQCGKLGIIVSTDFDENIPVLKISQEKIRQALLNIILNAIQVMPNGGKIKISTLLTNKIFFDSVKPSGKNHYVKIIIEDNGPGVPAGERETIFEPFFSNKVRGTGLGLSITHSIIEEHKGKIICENSELGGAKFSIFLPIENT